MSTRPRSPAHLAAEHEHRIAQLRRDARLATARDGRERSVVEETRPDGRTVVKVWTLDTVEVLK